MKNRTAELENYFNSKLLLTYLHAFLYKQYFSKQRQAKIGKNQAKPTQHPETELLLFDNYSLSSPTLSSKNNWRYSKKM